MRKLRINSFVRLYHLDGGSHFRFLDIHSLDKRIQKLVTHLLKEYNINIFPMEIDHRGNSIHFLVREDEIETIKTLLSNPEFDIKADYRFEKVGNYWYFIIKK